MAAKQPKPGVTTRTTTGPTSNTTRRTVQQGTGRYEQNTQKKYTPRGSAVTTTGWTTNNKGKIDKGSITKSKTFQPNTKKKPV
jgi:hypothetical protein